MLVFWHYFKMCVKTWKFVDDVCYYFTFYVSIWTLCLRMHEKLNKELYQVYNKYASQKKWRTYIELEEKFTEEGRKEGRRFLNGWLSIKYHRKKKPVTSNSITVHHPHSNTTSRHYLLTILSSAEVAFVLTCEGNLSTRQKNYKQTSTKSSRERNIKKKLHLTLAVFNWFVIRPMWI